METPPPTSPDWSRAWDDCLYDSDGNVPAWKMPMFAEVTLKGGATYCTDDEDMLDFRFAGLVKLRVEDHGVLYLPIDHLVSLEVWHGESARQKMQEAGWEERKDD